MTFTAIFLASFVIVHGSSVYHADNPSAAYFEKEVDVRMVNGVKVARNVKSRALCFGQCLEHRRTTGDLLSCYGVNYHPDTGDCEVCDGQNSTSSNSTGWQYWNVTTPREPEVVVVEPTEPTCLHAVNFEYPIDLLSTRGTSQGMISKDAASESSTLVYYMNGYSSVSALDIYPTEDDYKNNVNKETKTLPDPCCGASWLVFNHRLLCQRCADVTTVMVYDIAAESKTHTIDLNSVADGGTTRTAGSCSYAWGGSSDLDVEADSTGLYVLWTESCKFSISKIDPVNYNIIETWHTEVSKSSKGQAFMICGRMYLTDNYSAKVTNVGHVLDFASRTVNSTTSIPFRNRGYNSHTHYDHREQVLYSFDSGNQYKTKVNFQALTSQTCDHVSSFTYPRSDLTTSRGSNTQGYIGKDPLTPAGESIFYFMDGYSSVNVIKMYQTEANYISNDMNTDVTLPTTCCGASYNVIGGKLFCQLCSDLKQVYIYDLNRREHVQTISLVDIPDGQNSLGTASSCSYGWGGTSVVDIEVDSTGIYFIWPRASCYLSISKLTSYTDYTIAETWHTSVLKTSKGQAFMVCGRMYLTDNYSASSTTITNIFDFASKSVDTSTSIAFQNAGYNSHTHYDFRDQVLYAYDSNKQYSVDVNF